MTKLKKIASTETKTVLVEAVKLRPALVDDFLSLDKELKELTARHTAAKTDLKLYIKQYGGFDDVFIAKRKGKVIFDPTELYLWLIDNGLNPERAEEICPLTTRTIDEKALDEAFLDGIFTIDDIPTSCYAKGKESESLEIPANRLRKKKEDG